MPRIATLATDRLVLRPPSPGDLDDLASLFGDAEVVQFVTQGKALPRAQVGHMLESMLAEARHGSAHPSWVPGIPGTLIMIERETQNFVGMAVLRMLAADLAAAIGECPEPAVEAGYILARESWGKGFATEAARELVRYGIEVAGKEHVIAVADVGNTGSHGVLRKVGFVLQKEYDYRDIRMNFWRL